MKEEQLEFDFMIKDNQNFEGVGTLSIGGGSGGYPTGGLNEQAYRYMDDVQHNKEIILLLQVQFPETYKQIMDALKARDVLVNCRW